MSTEPETLVIFRRWPKREGGDVLALFPYEPGTYDPSTCTSYQHIGQHASADPTLCIRATEPTQAVDQDVRALARELRSIGYRLKIARRMPADAYEVRNRKIRGDVPLPGLIQ